LLLPEHPAGSAIELRRERANELTTNGSHYRDLGIVRHFSTPQIKWAYEQQVNADPENLRRYLKALEDIASLRQNEDLQTHAALISSQIDQIAPDIDDAYRMITIDPVHAKLMSEDIIIDAYNRTQEKGSENEKRNRREALKVIGRHRNSQLILKVAERDGSRKSSERST
jgi:ubiquitin carboxyl-terminal hydrolase 25/28